MSTKVKNINDKTFYITTDIEDFSYLIITTEENNKEFKIEMDYDDCNIEINLKREHIIKLVENLFGYLTYHEDDAE